MERDDLTFETFLGSDPSLPLVVLNSYMKDGAAIKEELGKLRAPEANLVVISNLRWDDDLTPWPIERISQNDTPCQGKADEYLAYLLEKLLPSLEGKKGLKPKARIIAGYSLGGLFALYAGFKTDRFASLVSASGSLWYPGFLDFARKNQFSPAVNSVYLSLGDKEKKTKNRILQPVEDNTLAFRRFLEEKGIKTIFEMNHGNHFVDGERRMAKGIAWALGNWR